MKKKLVWKTKAAKKEFLSALMNDVRKKPISYSKDQNHDLGDFINHFKFGFGFIQKIIGHTKVEVFFENSEKVMLQNWR